MTVLTEYYVGCDVAYEDGFCMTVLTEYYVGCDAEYEDGFCTVRITGTYGGYDDALDAARDAGWLVGVDDAAIDICPRCAGTNV